MQTAKTKTKQNKSSIISEFHIRLLFPIMNITRVEKSRSINQPATCTLGTYHQALEAAHTAQRLGNVNLTIESSWTFSVFQIWLKYKIRDPFCLFFTLLQFSEGCFGKGLSPISSYWNPLTEVPVAFLSVDLFVHIKFYFYFFCYYPKYIFQTFLKDSTTYRKYIF